MTTTPSPSSLPDPTSPVDVAAALLGVALRPEWRAAALASFTALRAAAALVEEFPLDDEAEYGPVFTP